MRALLLMGLCGLVVGCAALRKETLEEPGPIARAALREGNFVEATLVRRFADGNLLVRLQSGQVLMLGPKQTCSWCWIYVSRRVYVDLQERSAVLLSPKGERMGCWNGGPVDSY